MSELFLMNSKSTSKASIKKHANMRSPRHAPFSNLKYGVINSPFIMHIVDHLIILLLNK